MPLNENLCNKLNNMCIFNNLNLCLYDKDIIVNVSMIKEIVNEIRGNNYGVEEVRCYNIKYTRALLS